MRLEATRSALDALRTDGSVLLKSEGASRLNERMQVMASSTAGVRTFVWVNAAGISIASNRPELVGIDFHDGERYRRMSSRPDPSLVYVSPPFQTPLGTWALSLGRVLLDSRGRFDGYVLAIIDPEYFNLLLDSARYAPDMATAMIHGQGKLIYRVPDPQGGVGMDLGLDPESGFARHIQSGASTSSCTRVLRSTGREALMVFQTIRPARSSMDEILVASFIRDTAAVFAAWRDELRDGVALLTFAALASILTLFLHQRRRAALARLQAEQDEERKRQEAARLALQAQLARSQRLESIGRLAGGLAHDFNNILTVILSCGEELRARFGDGDPLATETADEILAASQRARELTSQLLAFARKQIIDPVALNLNSIIEASQRMLTRLLGEDIRLSVQPEEALWSVHADPGQIEQILFNLVVNARDAMPGGGTLTITTQNRKVDEAETRGDDGPLPGDWVELLVRDSGTGMTPEVQARVFEPFFTTKGQGKGTGLGLATVYGIVAQAGGHIYVRSQPGTGTVFQVYLPRTHQAPSQRGPSIVPARTTGTEPILVVEDDPLVRTVIVRMLSGEGYEISAVHSAEQALAIPDEQLNRIKLMVTDVVMPGLDGRTLAIQLRGRTPGLKVLFLSGYTRDALSARGVLNEGIEFLAKPVSRSTLLTKVRAVLDEVN